METSRFQPIGFQLNAMLYEFGIPINLWQKPLKTITDLVEEILAGESELIIDKNGLRRELRIVSMVITDSDKNVLIERHHVRGDGTVHQRDNFPAGKIYLGEGILEALAREMKEELGLEPNQYQVHELMCSHEEEHESPSFSGLLTKYTIYRYHITLQKGVEVLNGYQVNVGGTKLVFWWKPFADYINKIWTY